MLVLSGASVCACTLILVAFKGLVEAMRILDKIKGISFVRLNQQDVIRHRLVKNIINAYEVEENKSEPSKTKSKADESTAGN